MKITKDLILRHAKLSDLQRYYETETDGISKKMFMSYPKNIKEAKKDIVKHIADNKKKSIVSETFSIVKNRKYAGYVKIQFQNFNPKSKEGRIHVAIHPDFRGEGIATKAIKSIIEYGFIKKNFDRIFAQCKFINKGVAKINKKIGFRLEKIHNVKGIKKMWWVLEKTEYQIKEYFENLNSKQLNLKSKIKVNSISRLGMGTSNLNYLVKVNGSKFIFRLNMDPKNKGKSRKEFNALKSVEKYGISPKILLVDESRKVFDSDFIIITYIDGKTVDKTKEYLKPKMIKQIARLCAKLHLIKIKGNLNKLSKVDSIKGYTQYYKSLKREYLNYINSNLKDKKLLRILNETYKNLYLNIPKKKYNSDIVLSQGDFCEQNIIVHKNKYKLIDFEDLELTDRASHLAHLLTDFGRPFESDQKKLFLKEYFKIIKVNEKELVDKIEIWIPLKLFAVFLWSIKHVLRIKNKEMHSKFIEQDDMKNNLSYVKTMLKRNIRFEIVDSKYKDFDIIKALS